MNYDTVVSGFTFTSIYLQAIFYFYAFCLCNPMLSRVNLTTVVLVMHFVLSESICHVQVYLTVVAVSMLFALSQSVFIGRRQRRAAATVVKCHIYVADTSV